MDKPCYIKLTVDQQLKDIIEERAAKYELKRNQLVLLILESYFYSDKKSLLETFEELTG